ncbi:hypothetical protein [Gracilibacillus sp. YIM 98692]|uniref:hypothetical protein n=1 Tax=Gracilibacillus sp. YIM 98692 TaxID=2663532 RepID=UPI0013D71E6E|nr:hypothetical protein [Gracilibacillus sp. YIM 98692]
MTENKGFIFLGDIIKLPEEIKEYQIIQGYVLKKANQNQVEEIRKYIGESGHVNFYKIKYESIVQKNEDHVDYKPSDDFHDWNYWIIEHNEKQSRYNIKLALLLAKINLFTLFEKLPDTGTIHQQYAYHNFITENIGVHNVKEISQTDLDEIQKIYNLLTKIDEENYPYIDKSVKDYMHLQTIPRRTPFYVLGMFSILEALLVSNSEEVSISHQLKTKISLLNNRFDTPIDFSDYFGKTNYNKVITLLYNYRSNIAHGNFSDFNGKLQVLVKPEHVSKVIHNILKATLKQALIEPQLITDLKNC